jgi:ankyrin repeat protein
VNTGWENNTANAEIARMLLDAGADPDVRATERINGPEVGDSLLYFAARYHNLPFLKQLLETGADPHATAANGQSAMDHALNLRQADTVKTLLEFGFDPHKVFDYTIHWTGRGACDEHRTESAVTHAQRLVEQFGHDSEYGLMLDIIEAHVAKEKSPPKPKTLGLGR